MQLPQVTVSIGNSLGFMGCEVEYDRLCSWVVRCACFASFTHNVSVVVVGGGDYLSCCCYYWCVFLHKVPEEVLRVFHDGSVVWSRLYMHPLFELFECE